MINGDGLPAVRYYLKLSKDYKGNWTTKTYVRDSSGGLDVSMDKKKQVTPFHNYIKDVTVQSQW